MKNLFLFFAFIFCFSGQASGPPQECMPAIKKFCSSQFEARSGLIDCMRAKMQSIQKGDQTLSQEDKSMLMTCRQAIQKRQGNRGAKGMGRGQNSDQNRRQKRGQNNKF